VTPAREAAALGALLRKLDDETTWPKWPPPPGSRPSVLDANKMMRSLPALAAYCDAADALREYVVNDAPYDATVESFDAARAALVAALTEGGRG